MLFHLFCMFHDCWRIAHRSQDSAGKSAIRMQYFGRSTVDGNLYYLKRTNVFPFLPQFGRPPVLYAPHAPTWAGPTWAVALIPSHLHLARMCFNFPQAWPPPSSRRTQNRMSVPWPLPLRRRRHSPWRTAPRRNPWPPPPLCRR
jgi:hypothetical protein